MQNELRAARPGWNIEIVGLNLTNFVSFNPIATAGRTLPWLQDRTEVAAWQKWKVVYRDVRILDPLNRLHAIYNLTTHNLAITNNFLALKQLFLDAAQIVDADKDRLPDLWEERFFAGPATTGGDDDPDFDGWSNLQEWLHGSDPLVGTSQPAVGLVFQKNGLTTSVVGNLRRPVGPLVRVLFETSSDLVTWTAPAGALPLAAPDVNLFDGTGMARTSLLLDRFSLETPKRFFRVRVEPLVP